jgi:hypothetical protein
MPSNGPVGVFSASPQSTGQAEDFTGPIPAAPDPSWDPAQVVTGFLAASASYPTFAATARQYLVGSASRHWNPGWQVTVFQSLTPNTPVTLRGGQQAKVDVTGSVQATFNGSGEFVSASRPHKPASAYSFNLVKVNGQWRISNPPTMYRLLTQEQFVQDYKPQDLYFVNPNTPSPVLVPDSVFVPIGTSSTALVTNLVTALIQGPKNNTWLQGAASTSFPAKTTLLGVALDGNTAVVNLGGALAKASPQTLKQVSAQLLWTLASPQAGVSSPIQSVQLEINGKAWIPPGTICGTSPSQGPVQQQADYGCYAPFPATPASFSFVGAGTALSRCGWVREVAGNSIGPVVPVFGRSGRARGGQPGPDDRPVTIQSQGPSAQQPPPGGVPAMVAVSPDGQVVAYVVPGRNADAIYIRSLVGATSASGTKPLQQPGVTVTSLGWDIRDDLWFTTSSGGVFMASGAGEPLPVSVSYPVAAADVVAMSVAPDGVRVALILQVGPQRVLELGAVDRSGQQGAGQLGSQSVRPWITTGVQLGTSLDYPVALTWYDADNLLVLTADGSQKALYEVPVDGQESAGPLPTPPGATSITAHGPGNALVAGLANGTIEVSASLEGPWQTLGVHGSAPAYP